MLAITLVWIAGRGAYADERPSLTDAPASERQAIDRFTSSDVWPHRALAALRLERYGDPTSLAALTTMCNDSVWQVRAMAIRIIRRRGDVVPPEFMTTEANPRVIRTALRHHVPFNGERLETGIRALAKSESLDDLLLTVELIGAAQIDDVMPVAEDALRKVITRMNRTEAGVLAPRLARMTGAPAYRRDYQWRRWLMKYGRRDGIRSGHAFPPEEPPTGVDGIAALSSEQFVSLRNYLANLDERELELVVCLDTTASMRGELAQAQGELDAMVGFLDELLGGVRIGLVAYRDRTASFETKTLDLTNDVVAVRGALWSLSADEGGDSREAVYRAMRTGVYNMNWTADAEKVLIVVGDAPPHVGYGSKCADIARTAARSGGLITHTVQAKGKPVDHFETIAAAGGGSCVTLDEHDALVVELAGLTVSGQYRESFQRFFQTYMDECR